MCFNQSLFWEFAPTLPIPNKAEIPEALEIDPK